MSEIITIKSAKVVQFYNMHKQLDIEKINEAMVDSLQNIILDLEGDITKTMVVDMVKCLKLQTKEISNMKLEFNNMINANTDITKNHQNLITSELMSIKDIVKHEFNNIICSNSELTKSHQNLITSELMSIKDIVNKLNTEISNSVISKFYEFSNNVMSKFCDIRNNYIEDMKLVVERSTGDSTIKIIDKLERENEKIVDKTCSILNEILPKNILQNYSHYESNIKNFKEDMSKHIEELKHSNMTTDKLQMIFIEKYNNLTTTLQNNIMNYIMSSEDKIKSTINEIKENNNKNNIQQENINNELVKLTTDKLQIIFIEKYNNLTTTLQNNIMGYIMSSEDKIKLTINDIKEINNKTNTQQEHLNEELVKFLSQYKISSKKGQFGENLLESILIKIFPSDEIINTTCENNSGDFILLRKDKVKILLETKNYDSQNVSKKEIEKFINNVRLQNCSGIMMSQRTGITSKQNFEIDIDNGNVLLYIHNCEYDSDKILLGCDIIDTISEKLKEFHKSDSSVTLSEESLIKINQEYQNFIYKRNEVMTELSESIKGIIGKIKKLELSNNLNTLLCSKFASTKISNNNSFKCNVCNAKEFTSMKALSNHKRFCVVKIEEGMMDDVIDDVIDKNNSETTTDVSEEVVNIDKNVVKKTTKKTKSGWKS